MSPTMAETHLWWETDEEAWLAVQHAAAKFFDGEPHLEYNLASEEFAASLEQLWAMSEGLA